MNKYSCYEYEIIEEYDEYFVYKIHADNVIESEEWYNRASDANHAAIDHIDRLEAGEK